MKVLIVIGIILISTTLVAGVPTCVYSEVGGLYTCTLSDANISKDDPSTIDGNHVPPKADTDVKRVTVPAAASEHIIQHIMTKYANLEILEILDGSNVKSLPKFATCTFLKELKILGGEIGTLAKDVIRECNALAKIDLSRNKITTLADSSLESGDGLTNLIFLNLSQNSIATVATRATTFTKLDIFDFSGNPLTEFPSRILDLNVNVKEIYLQDHRLTTIPSTLLEKFMGLQKLYIGSSFITTIDPKAFEKLTALTELSLRSSKITILTENLLSTLVNLKVLDLENVQLTDTSFEALKKSLKLLTKLEKLNIGNNNLASVDDLFTANTLLTELKINNINLKTIPTSAFTKNEKLDLLSLSGNNLTEIADNMLEKNVLLTKLYLRSNQLMELKGSPFGATKNLEVLDLASNSIRKIEPNFFSKLTKLKELHLSGNQCVKDDYQSPTEAKYNEIYDKCKGGAATIIISNLLLILTIFIKYF